MLTTAHLPINILQSLISMMTLDSKSPYQPTLSPLGVSSHSLDNRHIGNAEDEGETCFRAED